MSTQLFSINDIQEALGIGRNKVYSLLQSGEISAFKIGREWKVTEEAVEAYIAKHNADTYKNMIYGSNRPLNVRFKDNFTSR